MANKETEVPNSNRIKQTGYPLNCFIAFFRKKKSVVVLFRTVVHGDVFVDIWYN